MTEDLQAQIKDALAAENVVLSATKRLIKESLLEREGAVYKVLQKIMGCSGEIKRLKNELTKANESLSKANTLLERAKNGDFGWISQDNSKPSED